MNEIRAGLRTQVRQRAAGVRFVGYASFCLALLGASCATDTASAPPGGTPDPNGHQGGKADCVSPALPVLTSAKIGKNAGQDSYLVDVSWDASKSKTSDTIRVDVASRADADHFDAASPPAPARDGGTTAEVDKLLPDIFVRLRATSPTGCESLSNAVRLAKPDYSDPSTWKNGWIRVVSHTHTIADEKKDAGLPVHANRINWFNSCFQTLGNDSACHELMKRSFSEAGVEWLMAAAKDKGIDSVIVTDHDNVGIWYTDTFRKFNRADASGPSVVGGLEWTSGLGHMTVIGDFLKQIPKSASVYDAATAKQIQTSTLLPPDECDDTDQNHDIDSPLFDGPDRPCARADHHGHGDDSLTVGEARSIITELKASGALVYANHPTNKSPLEPPMSWQLGNFDLLDGVEAATPDPTLVNRNAPEYWRNNGLQGGQRWVGIAGTDCHVQTTTYNGDSACNTFHGIVAITHMDAPYMWVQPLASTSRPALNAPDLVVAALREGRVTVVQDIDPAVVVDLSVDANGDGKLDYVGGSTLPACEQPKRTSFPIEVRVMPVQTHNYNVSIWRNGKETKILQDQKLEAGKVWIGKTELRRGEDLPDDAARGYVQVQVRENKSFTTDNDAGFATPIWFEAPDAARAPCNTRDQDGR